MNTLTSVLTRRAALGALIGATLLSASCAALNPATPEEIVNRRVQERWDALIKRDFAKAYSYTQPGYRAIVSADNYAKRFGTAGKWLSMDVYSTTCEPERCTVKIRLTSEVFMPSVQGVPGKSQKIQGFQNETWIKDEGQLWFYQAS